MNEPKKERKIYRKGEVKKEWKKNKESEKRKKEAEGKARKKIKLLAGVRALLI